MEIEARLFGCVAMNPEPGVDQSLRERYAPLCPGWRTADLPGVGFVAVASDGVLLEDLDAVTAAAGSTPGNEIHDAARRSASRFSAFLNGQFCVARYDAPSATLRLAVDTFGIERLFYCERNGVLCFSDDVAALWSWFGVERRPCPESIDAYFTLFQIPAPLSGFADIRQVSPNSVVTISAGRIQVEEAVWKPETAHTANREEALRELEVELGVRVAGALGNRASAALLFSGGVDSMLLAALLCRAGVNLETHSFGEAGSEELEIAAQRASWLSLPHRCWSMPARLSLESVILKWRMPVSSMRVTYVDWFCTQVASGSRYLVSGSGADGVFSGDPIWRRLAHCSEGPLCAPRLYRRGKRFARRYLYGSRLRKLLSGRAPETPLVRAYEQQGLLFQYLVAARPSVIDAYARAVGRGCVTLFPFLSRQVIELALYLGDDSPKGALKTLLARSVPGFPIGETKRGFGQSVSLSAIFADCGGAGSWASRIVRGPLCGEGFLDPRAVSVLFEESTSDPSLQDWAWGVGALDSWFRLLIAS